MLKFRHYVKYNKDEGSAHDLLKLQHTAYGKKKEFQIFEK